ncbi:hypothetical protein AA103587_2568 [Gluconobacter kanchanaburiensis NBRC 103587]|nr:hypothetical protein AA103587_2568 [Gluconobacter kanchanaburiensis NBRC 103587]
MADRMFQGNLQDKLDLNEERKAALEQLFFAGFRDVTHGKAKKISYFFLFVSVGGCKVGETEIETHSPDRGAHSSAVEHYLDMVGVTGSIPVAPTTRSGKKIP